MPVHAQPTGEHVASICLDCDEQLDVPGRDAEEPSSEPAAPSNRGRPGARKKTPSGKAPTPQAPPSRSYVKPLLFTVSAGAFGYGIGLVGAIGAFLPAADHQATDAIGLTLACASGYGTWRALGVQGVVRYLPGGVVGRLVASVFAVFVAPGLAPDGVQILDEYGARIGLDASGIALVSASVAICGGLYWAIDRRFMASPALVRWLARVPLASALVAVALYGPGPR
ncbi:hypothetical protein OG824_31775 [Streptomyces prunicolor]|uniref:hypothetical protein n=1 Tax=Streptomyces prunicolor TaxID=67348 RepID=UPI0022593A05|nr:hypothetical protein [Streptomyces prunicolor]MCX5239790.1 hypothetical protein [Streptomyces prunicolor]